jgi:hypothetical protein
MDELVYSRKFKGPKDGKFGQPENPNWENVAAVFAGSKSSYTSKLSSGLVQYYPTWN